MCFCSPANRCTARTDLRLEAASGHASFPRRRKYCVYRIITVRLQSICYLLQQRLYQSCKALLEGIELSSATCTDGQMQRTFSASRDARRPMLSGMEPSTASIIARCSKFSCVCSVNRERIWRLRLSLCNAQQQKPGR